MCSCQASLQSEERTFNSNMYLSALCAYCPLTVCLSKPMHRCDALSPTNAHPHLHAGIPGDGRTSFKSLLGKRSSSSFCVAYFPPACTAHTGAHVKVCANTHSLSARPPSACENLDQNDVDSGCEWVSVGRRQGLETRGMTK